MERRVVFGIVIAVVAAHAVVFWMVAGTNPLPKTKFVALPNFSAKEVYGKDAETGDPIVYREFQVSTKLAYPDVLWQSKLNRR